VKRNFGCPVAYAPGSDKETAIHPVYRFVARHSLFIGPGLGFVVAAWLLSRMNAPWPLWALLVAVIAIIWTVPIWRREKATALTSPEDLSARVRAGLPSVVHFYSDF
jgi:hypothetical protein